MNDDLILSILVCGSDEMCFLTAIISAKKASLLVRVINFVQKCGIIHNNHFSINKNLSLIISN